eukprot:s968_g49.t1
MIYAVLQSPAFSRRGFYISLSKVQILKISLQRGDDSEESRRRQEHAKIGGISFFFAKVYSTVCTEQLSMHTPSEATLTASCAAVQKAGRAIIDRTTRFSLRLDEGWQKA